MKMTNFMILAALPCICSVAEAYAQPAGNIVPGVAVDRLAIGREGRWLDVAVDMDLSGLEVSSNRAVVITPRLVNGTDSLDLPSVGIYGRRRYYYYVRNGINAISGEGERVYRASDRPDSVAYVTLAEYRDWMDGATLMLHRSDWGCCNGLLAEYDGAVGRHREAFFPDLVFVQPKGAVEKTRSLSGSAFIDFPVDQTVIYPDYRRNAVELGRIQATIDSVREDPDVTITSVWLKGFASPESPYSHNTELAIGRTAALKRHIGQLYHFADSVILTDHEPEDWEGLRRYVEQSNIDHRAEILAIIDSGLEPDAREAKIKRTYPEEYRFMLQNFYPALRHTDYRIDYSIRRFSDAEEIERIMAKEPQKLSLDELYIVAGRYEPGTDRFTEIFDTAVRLYPDDETANLNAANAAIRRDDFAMARRYLDRAGASAEAAYARAALAIREKDYDTARRLLREARDMGLAKAAETLGELDDRLK